MPELFLLDETFWCWERVLSGYTIRASNLQIYWATFHSIEMES